MLFRSRERSDPTRLLPPPKPLGALTGDTDGGLRRISGIVSLEDAIGLPGREGAEPAKRVYYSKPDPDPEVALARLREQAQQILAEELQRP